MASILREAFPSPRPTLAQRRKPGGAEPGGADTLARMLALACLLAAAACEGGASGGSGLEPGAGAAGAGAPASAASAACEPCPGCPGPSGSGGAAPELPDLRLMTFNMRHGAESSLEEVAAVIREERADVVLLQEVDVEASRSGRVDQPHRLGQLAGMTNLFRSALEFQDGGFYGQALLSRFPILTSEKLLLPVPEGKEQRIAALVKVELPGGKLVTFVTTHLGLTAEERVLQVDALLSKLGDDPAVVLGGDFNEGPEGPNVKKLASRFTDAWVAGSGEGPTHPAGAPERRIDFLFLGASFGEPTESWVPETLASDHRPVVTVVPLPE